MTINKFQGKTQEEAIAKAKEEFGERAVIMNIREVKPKGLFRAFKNSTFEVTAAMEEKEHFSNAMQAAQMTQSMAKEGKLHDMINLAADEPITIPKLQEQEGNAQATRQEPARMPQSQNLVQENEEKKLEERLEENEASIKNRKKSFQIDSLELNSSAVEPTVSLDANEKERE